MSYDNKLENLSEDINSFLRFFVKTKSNGFLQNE